MTSRRRAPTDDEEEDAPLDRTEDSIGYTRAELERQDMAFQDAMSTAVAAGLEHPPMIGVNKRAGTEKARPVKTPTADRHVRQKDNM